MLTVCWHPCRRQRPLRRENPLVGGHHRATHTRTSMQARTSMQVVIPVTVAMSQASRCLPAQSPSRMARSWGVYPSHRSRAWRRSPRLGAAHSITPPPSPRSRNSRRSRRLETLPSITPPRSRRSRASRRSRRLGTMPSVTPPRCRMSTFHQAVLLATTPSFAPAATQPPRSTNFLARTRCLCRRWGSSSHHHRQSHRHPRHHRRHHLRRHRRHYPPQYLGHCPLRLLRPRRHRQHRSRHHCLHRCPHLPRCHLPTDVPTRLRTITLTSPWWMMALASSVVASIPPTLGSIPWPIAMGGSKHA